jgi:hypothetical protein
MDKNMWWQAEKNRKRIIYAFQNGGAMLLMMAYEHNDCSARPFCIAHTVVCYNKIKRFYKWKLKVRTLLVYTESEVFSTEEYDSMHFHYPLHSDNIVIQSKSLFNPYNTPKCNSDLLLDFWLAVRWSTICTSRSKFSNGLKETREIWGSHSGS